MILTLFVAQPAIGVAADLHVDPNRGDDSSNGKERPVQSIAAAIRLAMPGDTIHLLPNTTYHDWALFLDKSGEVDKPITLDGHGATLDGCDPLDASGWTEVEPGLFRHDDLLPLTEAIVDRWFFVMDGRLNRMQRCSKGPSEPLKSSHELQPNEWTFVKDAERSKAARAGYIHGSFWLRLLPGQSLSRANIEIPFRPAGVMIRGKSSHLVIRNLTATRPYNDGFNLSDCQAVRFENIRAINCGDDGISAHGHCRYSVDGLASIGNATGICDTGTSETSYRHLLIRDGIGVDLFFLDSGIYSIRDAEIISSAAKSLYLQGRDVPAEPCRVTLDNVIIRRIRTANEVRVSPNCVLKADRLTLLNLDVLAPGGEIELKRSFIGGTVATNPERKPHVHLWKDTKWRAEGNWYNFDSVRVGQESFTAKLFPEFGNSVEAEHGSHWSMATEAELRLAGIGAVLATSPVDELTVAINGESPFVIVTPVQPNAEETTAAEWLATTLKQVTGADFAIHKEDAANLPQTPLFVGDTAAAREVGFGSDRFKPEEWRIKTIGEALILTGGRPRGTIYAVCEFLEAQVGVARLDPFTEFVPKQATLTIPGLDRSGRPAFPSRFIFTGWPYQNSLPQGVNGNRWRIWNKEHIYAGPASGDYPRAVPDGVHTFGHFISAAEFAVDHPEYFSMDADGKRMTDDKGNKQLWIQLCVTNPDVRRITVERAKQMLHDDEVEAKKTGREPAKMVVLSQNDNTSNLCLCPDCKAISDREGSESGALLDYVNHVARELKDEFPDVTVQTEAYNFTLAPPKTIRPEPNVMIRYCDNYGLSDMTRPLTDPRNAERLALLDGWAKSAQQIGIWDYWRTFDPHPPGLFAPSSNVRAMHRDIQLFRERNVQYVTIECEDFMGAGLNDTPQSNDLQSFMPLRCWLGMKLIDDPDRDLNALLETFCKGYYGDAARPMRELLDVIEERQSEITANSSNMRRHVWLEELCDPTFFANAYRCLDAAILLAKDDPASLIHVRRERIIVDAAFLWIEASVRRQAAESTAFPLRSAVLQRHRDDWTAYVASVYDEAGQKAIAPLIEPGLQLLEKLQTADTDSMRTAIATTEATMTHDGLLNESFWQQARTLRLLPRDPMASNDDNSSFRFGWTAEALYVGIEQPLDKAAAIYEVSLMTPDRTGTQVALHAQATGSVAAYFYAYPATGMVAVSNRTSLSKFVSSKTETHATAEFRIPWTDLPTEAKPADTLLFNIATYPKLDSPTPSHVSSPWLIGVSPTYNPAYYGTIRLGTE